MKWNSGIYAGQVRHRRLQPVPHDFSYHLFMMYLDLDELPNLFRGRWLWSDRRAALARFRREDHMGPADIPLDKAVRDLVEARTGQPPSGPIRLLTHLRYFGHVFNPVSFYYCFDKDDHFVETIVAEVNNTPWGEQHCYVLPQSENHGEGVHSRFFPKKVMHVSPFMEMDVDYDWRFNQPGDGLTVHMENAREGHKVFDATLILQRREISARSLAAVLFNFPLMTVKVVAAIHWQALRLWLKSVPVHDHPGKQVRATEDR
ncbi:MAG: DUF1365 domain-containing protein [Xanthomonadales bacterium]|jgi:DUF1365 family protein|nr:DUF1365 domain-containing protein [Xanthomonadales bacterium]